MASLIGIVITTLIVIGVGGGGAYLIWLKTRPKKMTWKCKVYQVGEGVKPPLRNKKGIVVSDIRLSDLRPYTKDVIEKIEKDPGITIFRLQKLNKTVPAVTSECVDYWGEKDKEVSAVMEGDTFTLLKKGYDRVASNAIFHPLGHDRINMIKGEMAIRKDRLRKEKDILQAITPWIVAGICMMGLVAIAYFQVDGFLQMNKINVETQKYTSDRMVEAANILKGVPGGENSSESPVEVKKEKPPLVEGG